MTQPADDRQRLLLLVVPADHPHRDAACATLAWLAADEGLDFECYFAARASGVHYGGGHPSWFDRADLRGGTFSGGRHLEQLYAVLTRYRCEVAALGDTPFDPVFAEARVPVRARADDIASFYRAVFSVSPVTMPDRILVVGDGGRPQDVPLGAYAWPEIVHRRLVAIAAGDAEALTDLGAGRSVEHLWDPSAPHGAAVIAAPDGQLVSTQTRWMASRWSADARGYLLGDPELAGRWVPAASRERWLPVFGMPQSRLIHEMREELHGKGVVYGRQQDDRDFLELSRAGVAFQLVDAGRPAFPATRAETCRPLVIRRSSREVEPEPSDEELGRWADERRVVSSLVFWTGMARELESLYALVDVCALTGVHAGYALTTASFDYMPRPPLTLVYEPRDLGGLAPRIEFLLASGGTGAFLESETPEADFAAALDGAARHVRELLGPELAPRGWWSVMDAGLVRLPRVPRMVRQPEPPFAKLRYGQPPDLSGPPPAASAVTAQAREPRRRGRLLKQAIRRSPLGAALEPARPFDAYRPGAPRRSVLEAVRDAGFEYALTKSAFGSGPAVVSGVEGLTALNYTVGRWDGWTPFATVNTLGDLVAAERSLLHSRRPGWLIGSLDTCLWAFSGPVWEQAPRLHAICAWLARGGSSGKLINVTPRTVARYARLLSARGVTRTIEASPPAARP